MNPIRFSAIQNNPLMRLLECKYMKFEATNRIAPVATAITYTNEASR